MNLIIYCKSKSKVTDAEKRFVVFRKVSASLKNMND